MTTHQTLARLETVCRWIESLRGDLDGELALRRDLICQARTDGARVIDIARAAGLARETVHRILQANS